MADDCEPYMCFFGVLKCFFLFCFSLFCVFFSLFFVYLGTIYITVTVTEALVLRPLLEDQGRITESIIHNKINNLIARQIAVIELRAFEVPQNFAEFWQRVL